MAVFAGRGDARRTVALLWRAAEGTRSRDAARTDAARTDTTASRSGPGPRPALSLDGILDAAIAVADGTGDLGFPLRAVGERLGTSAMALYTYVPGKAELIDLMYDRVFAEHPGMSGGSSWRADVQAWSESLLAVLVAHPWAVEVSPARPALGPNEQAVLEGLLGRLYDAGITGDRVRVVTASVFALVHSAARSIADAARAAGATGAADASWWAERASALADVVPDFAERFPASTRLATETAAAASRAGDPAPWESAPRDALRGGLALLLASL